MELASVEYGTFQLIADKPCDQDNKQGFGKGVRGLVRLYHLRGTTLSVISVHCLPVLAPFCSLDYHMTKISDQVCARY